MKYIVDQIKEIMLGSLESEAKYQKARCFQEEANQKYLQQRY